MGLFFQLPSQYDSSQAAAQSTLLTQLVSVDALLPEGVACLPESLPGWPASDACFVDLLAITFSRT